MKHGRKLTRKQKEFLESKKLNPNNWLAVKNTSKEMVIVHRESGKIKIFKKAS